MKETPLSTRPLTADEKILQEKFAASIADQSELMDNLGKQLLTLELAIPGLYATALTLVRGDKATLAAGPLIGITFGCWLLSLLVTLLSLTPRKYVVDRTILRQDPASDSEELGIEDFFHRAARYKRRLLIAASLLFFCGVICAAQTIA